jgi:dihydroxyacetone kinase-like protein
MSIGFTAVNEALGQARSGRRSHHRLQHRGEVLPERGRRLSGPLYGTAFMRRGAAVKGKTAIDRDGLADCIAAMAKGMQDRGKAERGEKTMMDAGCPRRSNPGGQGARR